MGGYTPIFIGEYPPGVYILKEQMLPRMPLLAKVYFSCVKNVTITRGLQSVLYLLIWSTTVVFYPLKL